MTTDSALRTTRTPSESVPSVQKRPGRGQVDRNRPAVVSQILLTIVLLIFLTPFVWMLATALTSVFR
jgi:ABC-type glycerol-3-phosphate transport system permease component